MASRVVLAVLLCAVITSSQSSKPVPLVIWHGMGEIELEGEEAKRQTTC